MNTEVIADNHQLRQPWTVDQLADFSGLDRKSVYMAIKRREVPSVRVGRRLLIPWAWIEAQFGRKE